MSQVTVIQHTSAEYLGLMEDHLEGRLIRFNYCRPFVEDVYVPHQDTIGDGLILLGGGPWGSAGTRDVPTLQKEIELAHCCLMLGLPIIGIGLGAQILAIAGGGSSKPHALSSSVGTAHRVKDGALAGYLPENYPLVTYMRDTLVLPNYAEVLAEDDNGDPALFQMGSNCFGFTGHPGIKPAMIEDLIMEFEEAPDNCADTMSSIRSHVRQIEDSLIPIMTGLILLTGLMNKTKP
jgi:GMP synthase-like glutamine amidotransferase